MYKISERAKKVLSSKVKESLIFLEKDPSVISLGAGEPDFAAPEHVIKFATGKLKESNHYSPLNGKQEFREEVARKLKKENKIEVEADEVIGCCGSKEAIFLSLLTLADRGDGVIIPDPGYLGYKPMVDVIEGTPISMRLMEGEDFEINISELEKLANERAKILIINSPSNPTGNVLKRKTLEEIADIVIEKNLMVISDEAYEKLVYDDAKHVSMASLNGMKDHVITTQTFSKAYAMCGFRIGYAAGPPEIIKKMTDLKITTTIAPSTNSQFAAIAALRGSQKYVERMRNEYDRRRRMLIKRLNEIPNLRCSKPRGAFYAFPNITGLKMNSSQAVEFLLKKSKVLTIPGTEFGKYGEGFIRLSYATAYEKIEEAMNRIEKAVKM